MEITTVGDIMLGRDLEEHCAESVLWDPAIGQDLSANLTTGNLECVLTTSDAANTYAHSNFRASEACARNHLPTFDVLSLANNHIYDFDDEGIEDTLRVLQEVDVKWVGIGTNREEAMLPAVFERGGKSVAVFGLTTVANPPRSNCRYVMASPDPENLSLLSEATGRFDFVLVHLHAGEGDISRPSPTVRQLHRSIRQVGVDVVIGHHPHVIQGWEQEEDRLSLYSLGDFIFDRIVGDRRLGLIARVELGEQIKYRVIPTQKTSEFRVTYLEPEERVKLEAHLRDRSDEFAAGTSDRLYLEEMAAVLPSMTLDSLKKDFRAGGIRALVRRARRVRPDKIRTVIKVLMRRVRTPSARDPE